MVRKSVRCGQRTGNTLRKHFMSFVSNHGYVNYNFINIPDNFEHAKYQTLFSRKDCVFPDGRKSHLDLVGDDDNKFIDIHLDASYREGNHVCYSLDKHQRWTLPSVIKENIESLSEEDFRVVLSERKTVTLFVYWSGRYSPTDLSGRFIKWNDCVNYVDSKTPLTQATPTKSASFFCDLRKKCLGEGCIEKKTGERKRKRHNLHCRGVQRKTELRQKAGKKQHEEKYTHYALLDGADNDESMAEFRYEVCDPSGMKARCDLSKWWNEDLNSVRDKGIYCHGRKSLLKQKGFVNGVRVAWKKHQLRDWADDFAEHVHKSHTKSFESRAQTTEHFHQSEEAVYVYDAENDETCCVKKKETLELDIFDCLMKSKQKRKSERKLCRGIKRKMSEEDLDFRSHIIYLNESKTEEEDKSNTKPNVPKDFSNAEVDVRLPYSAKCFFKKEDVDEFFRKTPVFCSTSSYPAIFVIPLVMSENESVDNISLDLKNFDGTVSALLLQQTLSSVVSSAAEIMECRLRIVGNEDLYSTEEATTELSHFIETQEEFLILSIRKIYQYAKDLMRQRFCHTSLQMTRKRQQELELEPVFDWLPTVTYNVTTVKQASLLIGGTQGSGELEKMNLPSSAEYLTQRPECEYDCAVCFTSLCDDGRDLVEGVLIRPCQHSYCRTCLFQYAMEKIRTGARCITCLEYKCESEIDPVTILSLVSVQSFGQWSYRQQEQVVMSTGLWKWCPNKTCDLILSLVAKDQKVEERRESVPRVLLRNCNIKHMMCQCRTEFCMECQKLPHWPASCQQFGEYIKALNIQKELLKEEDYEMTFRVNVKACPRCKEKVDKNGGCNAMSCRCGHHFCWLCLQSNPYSAHRCKEVPLQEVELANRKTVKFHVKFLEKAYSCRIRCKKFTRWKNTLMRKIQEMEGPVKSAGIHVDYGGLQTKLSTLCLQLQYLNVILESLKLMENVFISVSDLWRRSPMAKEINSLSKTIDFIISRTVELLQGSPDADMYSRIDQLQNFLSQKVKKMVLLSLYMKHVSSKRIQRLNKRTVHGQRMLQYWIAYA